MRTTGAAPRRVAMAALAMALVAFGAFGGADRSEPEAVPPPAQQLSVIRAP